MKFKANLIVEFDSDCIKNARIKLYEIVKHMLAEVPGIVRISVDEGKHCIFDNEDLK